MSDLVLPPPGPHAPAPLAAPQVRRGWWRRPVAPSEEDLHRRDASDGSGLPTPGGAAALLLCDLTPDAPADLVALADRLLDPGSPPSAAGYAWAAVVVEDLDTPVHPLLEPRVQAYASLFTRHGEWPRHGSPVPLDALCGSLDAKGNGISVGGQLRWHRAGSLHLVAADPVVRDATLQAARSRGWTVELPRPG